MFKSLSQKVGHRQIDLEKKNSKQETLNEVINKFIKENLGQEKLKGSVVASLEKGNLYITTSHKAIANEIIFKARPLYALLKQNRIVCNNLVIR